MHLTRSIWLLVLTVGLVLVVGAAVAVAAAPGWSAASPSEVTLPPCAIDPSSCVIPIPDGSVVGALPSDQIAFYAPGKLTAPNVTINAGTYWVTGIGTADDGSQFYRIIVGCLYLYVPIDSMQPSYQAPWNGEPLPTNEITVEPSPSKWCNQIRRG